MQTRERAHCACSVFPFIKKKNIALLKSAFFARLLKLMFSVLKHMNRHKHLLVIEKIKFIPFILMSY